MRNACRKIALLAIPLVIASGAVLSACGGKEEPKMASVKPSAMPEGASWDGVYFNPQFGNLHLLETGGSIAGKWKRTDGSAWGELNGPVQANVFHYEWTEHKVGLIGPSSTTKGKGYFVYQRPSGENVDDNIVGEWGLNDRETGNPWDGIKQRHVKPDLKSIGGEQESGGPSKDWK